MKYLSAIALMLVIAGCSLIEKPNNSVAYTSDQLFNIAIQVEQAQSIGALSEVEGDKYLTWLHQANDLLRGSSQTFNNIEACRDSQTKFQCIDKIVVHISEIL